MDRARRGALAGLATAALATLAPSLSAWAAAPKGSTQTTSHTTPLKPPKTATILVVGDSLSAEYGLPRGSGWVALLEKRLVSSRTGTTVVNASISGDTTSGGAARLPALLKAHRPTHVIIELGGNDALRGLSLKATKQTLDDMVRGSQAAGARVVLVGMMMPPNFGRRYAEDFAAIFPAVAKARSAAVVPFFLKGVADRPDARDWFQADGIHPLAKAQPLMLDNVWPVLAPLL